MNAPIKQTSSGEWIVTTNEKEIAVVQLCSNGTQKTIATFGNEADQNANEHIANAALLSASKEMLDTLIAIQDELTTSKKIINLEALNEMLSEVFAKLANEAGEEL